MVYKTVKFRAASALVKVRKGTLQQNSSIALAFVLRIRGDIGAMSLYDYYAYISSSSPFSISTSISGSVSSEPAVKSRQEADEMKVYYIDQLKSVQILHKYDTAGNQPVADSDGWEMDNELSRLEREEEALLSPEENNNESDAADSTDSDAPAPTTSTTAYNLLGNAIVVVGGGGDYSQVRQHQPCPHAKCVKMSFMDGTDHYFIVADAQEFVEVVGAHLRQYNLKRIKAVNAVKDLFHLKSAVDFTVSDQLDGRALSLLRRLWRSSFKISRFDPPVDLQLLQKNEAWKALGFQSDRPATDFRGMGLLGLWLLVYIAERSEGLVKLNNDNNSDNKNNCTQSDYFARPGWVQEMAHVSRQSVDGSVYSIKQYPWAAAGINIGSMILDKFFLIDRFSVGSHPGDRVWDSDLLKLLCYEEDTVSTPPPPPALADREDGGNEDNNDNMNLPLRHLEEFFVLAVELLDRLYTKLDATYMDFPKIIQMTESILKQWLAGDQIINASSSSSSDLGIVASTELLKPRRPSTTFMKKPSSLRELWAKMEKDYPLLTSSTPKTESSWL